jgi:tRNA(Ile)-lysidine synthase
VRAAGPDFSSAIDGDEAASLFNTCSDAGGLLVGVSGGPDSIALMGLLARWREGLRRESLEAPPALFIATVDHGLREAAREEAALVAEFARALGLPHATLHWAGPKPRAGLPAAARAARYGLLVAHARALGATHIATAHTLDDQAETVMMRLAAGSGPSGLAGMREFSQRGGITHWRPLLGVPKARLVATCIAHGWPHVADPTNADPRFARSRWRRLMPELAKEGLSAARLATLARRQARIDDALDAQARACLGEPVTIASVTAFAQHALATAPAEIVVRALGIAIRLSADAANDHSLPRPHLRLERIERLATRITAALQSGSVLKASISGLVFSLDKAGRIELRLEGSRKRGRAGALPEYAAITPRQRLISPVHSVGKPTAAKARPALGKGTHDA